MPIPFATIESLGDSSNTQEMLSQDTLAIDESDVGSEFPSSLEGFGYMFKDGKLVDKETGGGFEFMVRADDQNYNQRHYEALGEVINEHVYELLETEGKLKKIYIPTDAPTDEACSFIFVSEDIDTNKDKLMMIIHGSGAVRAGQWSRRLIINDCLDSGTQLPYIRRAQQDGYAVIVLNTNLNYVTGRDGARVAIRGSSRPSEQGVYVWDKFISQSPAKYLCIVAHSYGGVVTLDMAIAKGAEFLSRVNAVAFTDSVHEIQFKTKSKDIVKFFLQKCLNWVSSTKPLGADVKSTNHDCPNKSSGTATHELTSWMCINEVFLYLTTAYQRTIKQDL